MFIIGFLGYFIFQIACAVAPNGPALLVFRFLSGCFAACPLTNSGALLGDVYVVFLIYPLSPDTCCRWNNEERGSATAIFTLSPFAGPAIGPIVGGEGSQTLPGSMIIQSL